MLLLRYFSFLGEALMKILLKELLFFLVGFVQGIPDEKICVCGVLG